MNTKTIAVLLAAAWVAACGANDTVAPVNDAPGFTVTGVVRDPAGIPLPGALADLGVYAPAWTNAAGVFTLQNVRGSHKLRVWKEAYTDFSRELTITSDLFLEVVLTAIPYADTLVLGKAVRSIVLSNAPPCDPIHWDARAPCRKFKFTAPQTGLLVVTVIWEYDPQLDVTITTGNGTYLAYSFEERSERATVSTRVARGEVYEIRVNSYYEAQVFDIRADLYADASALRTPHSRNAVVVH